MTTIGIIGAGHIGSALAEAFAGLGYDVVIANSRGPETLSALTGRLGPRVTASTAAGAAEAADVAVVTVPLKAVEDIPVDPLAGKIVLDTNNYYFERDGRIGSLDRGETTTSQLLQEHLPSSKVVKAFNHIAAGEILTTGSPAGTSDRRALGTSSDDEDAIAFVTDVYGRHAFATAAARRLSESWRLERDRPAYVTRQNAEELRANLAAANRLP